VERISAANSVGGFLRDNTGDPGRAIRGNMRDQCAAFGAESVEERGQGGLVLARCRPDETAGIVVDDAGQILVAALVTDLVNPDPGEAGELVELLLGIGPNPGDDRADGAPGDAHQHSDGGLGCLRGQPRDLVIEEQRVTALMPGPRHGGDRDAMHPAAHPRRRGF
jgi:hypothetical protein